MATRLERNSAQLGTGRSQNKKLLVRVVVDADPKERRQAGKGLSSLGVQSGGMYDGEDVPTSESGPQKMSCVYFIF